MSQMFSLMAVQIAWRVVDMLFNFDKILKGPSFCQLLHISDLSLLIFVIVSAFNKLDSLLWQVILQLKYH